MRRLARKQDLRVEKSRSRTPADPSCGGYWIVNPYNNTVEAGSHPHPFAMSLEEVEEYFKSAT